MERSTLLIWVGTLHPPRDRIEQTGEGQPIPPLSLLEPGQPSSPAPDIVEPASQACGLGLNYTTRPPGSPGRQQVVGLPASITHELIPIINIYLNIYKYIYILYTHVYINLFI